jgi:hypothetical protein
MDEFELRAMNLDGTYQGRNDDSDDVSEASTVDFQNTREADDHEQRIRDNTLTVAITFPDRRVRADGILEIPGRRGAHIPLHASRMRHFQLLHPYCYSADRMLREGSLRDAWAVCREARGLPADPTEAENQEWRRVLARLVQTGELRRFANEKHHESNIKSWLEGLVISIANFSGKRDRCTATEYYSGVKGSIADSHSNGCPRRNSGYYSKSDYVFKRGRSVVGLCELKYDRSKNGRTIWYRLNCVLAQVMGGLGGSSSCRVAVILTQKGYKLVYRRLVGHNAAMITLSTLRKKSVNFSRAVWTTSLLTWRT